MDIIRSFAPQLLLVFLAVLLTWFIYRSLSVLRRPVAPTERQVVAKEREAEATTSTNPFQPSDIAKDEQPSIIVQSPIAPKKEYFVMRADSKTASILGGESSDLISRQGGTVDMGDISQRKT